MRPFLSTVLGLALIVGLYTAGSASSVVDQPPPLSRYAPVPFDLPFTDGPATPSVVATIPSVVPDPAVEETRVAWFGCEPPRSGTICGPLASTGLERLLPADPSSVEDWRPLVAMFFEDQHVDKALRVMRCESNGNPDAKNPRSTASGLFQHLASMWPERSVAAGFAGVDVFDPIANVGVAAYLVYEGGGWSHWYPSARCWG